MSNEREGQLFEAAMKAYDRHGRHSDGIGAVIDTLRPLIAADTLRTAAQAAERVTQVYDQDSDDGWRRWMRERAEVLERSRRCAKCGGAVVRIPCPTGDWWAHIDHPADNHDAEVPR